MADSSWFLLSLIAIVPLALLLLIFVMVRPRPVRVPIKNHHVFITGGSSGIGLTLAHRVASERARVSILARSLDKLEEVRESIRLATGVEAAVYAVDLWDNDAVAKAVAEAGAIDVLVVNHGVFIPAEIESQLLDEVKFTVDVNLMGSFDAIRAPLPEMRKRQNRGPALIAIMSYQAGQVITMVD